MRRRQTECRDEVVRIHRLLSLRAARRPDSRSLPLRTARALRVIADHLEATAARAS
ncbi:MAG TPA: hypothetical protein VOB72_10415 [Candidatus Dormibacteraeota bacterium]|nr:hypothetical protein [Candidatus Dormibacteraeota bacterium]